MIHHLPDLLLAGLRVLPVFLVQICSFHTWYIRLFLADSFSKKSYFALQDNALLVALLKSEQREVERVRESRLRGVGWLVKISSRNRYTVFQ